MANKKGKQTKQVQRKGKATKVVASGGVSLDAAARQYAALLQDPCGAPLARPVYGATGTGYLIKLEASTTVTTDATNDGYRYVLMPGAFDPDVAGAGCRKAAMWNLAPSTNNGYPYTFNNAAVPGWNFWGQMTSWRAVAACVEVTYIGKETDRAGMLGFRATDYENVSSSPLSALQALGMSQRQMRVPNDTVTFRWAPTESDALWVHQNAATDTDIEREKGRTGVEVAIVGAGSFRIRSTIVVEWRPTGVGDALGASVQPVDSRNTLRDVLRFLGGMGDWAFRTAHEGAIAASKIAAGARATKTLVGGVRTLMIG